MSTTLRQLAAAARARLEASGIDPNEAAMDAAVLARHVLGWELARLVAHETDPPPAGFAGSYDALIARRAGREPVSIILGRREFWGLEFEVTRDVLAPRPETEIVIEAVLDHCSAALEPGDRNARALLVDVGTGSGCLAVCLAREFPAAAVVATDVSAAALEVARRNAARHQVGERVALVRTSLLEGLTGAATVIVSNPPYVPASDIASLPPEVRDWEPRTALDGGADGLAVVRALLQDAPRVLVRGGWLIMEFGFGQEDGIRRAVGASAVDLVEVRRDLQGIPRTLVARMAT